MDCRGIGERSDADLRTATPGNDELKIPATHAREPSGWRSANCERPLPPPLASLFRRLNSLQEKQES
jgi:hypothetical protein